MSQHSVVGVSLVNPITSIHLDADAVKTGEEEEEAENEEWNKKEKELQEVLTNAFDDLIEEDEDESFVSQSACSPTGDFVTRERSGNDENSLAFSYETRHAVHGDYTEGWQEYNDHLQESNRHIGYMNVNNIDDNPDLFTAVENYHNMRNYGISTPPEEEHGLISPHRPNSLSLSVQDEYSAAHRMFRMQDTYQADGDFRSYGVNFPTEENHVAEMYDGGKLNQQFFDPGASGDNHEITQLKILCSARGRKLQELNEQYQNLHTDSMREIRLLTHKFSLSEEEKNSISENLQELQRLLDSRNDELDECNAQTSALQAEIDSLKEGKQEIIRKLQTAEKTIESLHLQLKDLGKSENMARVKVQHERILTNMTEKHEQEILALKLRRDKFAATLNIKDEEHERLQKQLIETTRELEEARIEKADTINRLHKSLEESQNQYRELLETSKVGELNRLKTDLLRCEADKKTSEEKLAASQSDVTELKEHLGLYESAAKLGVLNYRQKSNLSSVKKTLDYSTTVLNSRQDEITNESLSNKMIHDLKHEHEKLLLAMSAKRAQMSLVQSELDASKQQLLQASENVIDLKNCIKQTEEELKDKNREIDELKNNRGTREEQRLNVKITALETEIDKLLRDKDDFEQITIKYKLLQEDLLQKQEEWKAEKEELVRIKDKEKQSEISALSEAKSRLDELQKEQLEKEEIWKNKTDEQGKLLDQKEKELEMLSKRLKEERLSREELAKELQTSEKIFLGEMSQKLAELSRKKDEMLEEKLAELADTKNEELKKQLAEKDFSFKEHLKKLELETEKTLKEQLSVLDKEKNCVLQDQLSAIKAQEDVKFKKLLTEMEKSKDGWWTNKLKMAEEKTAVAFKEQLAAMEKQKDEMWNKKLAVLEKEKDQQWRKRVELMEQKKNKLLTEKLKNIENERNSYWQEKMSSMKQQFEKEQQQRQVEANSQNGEFNEWQQEKAAMLAKLEMLTKLASKSAAIKKKELEEQEARLVAEYQQVLDQQARQLGEMLKSARISAHQQQKNQKEQYEKDLETERRRYNALLRKTKAAVLTNVGTQTESDMDMYKTMAELEQLYISSLLTMKEDVIKASANAGQKAVEAVKAERLVTAELIKHELRNSLEDCLKEKPPQNRCSQFPTSKLTKGKPSQETVVLGQIHAGKDKNSSEDTPSSSTPLAFCFNDSDTYKNHLQRGRSSIGDHMLAGHSNNDESVLNNTVNADNRTTPKADLFSRGARTSSLPSLNKDNVFILSSQGLDASNFSSNRKKLSKIKCLLAKQNEELSLRISGQSPVKISAHSPVNKISATTTLSNFCSLDDATNKHVTRSRELEKCYTKIPFVHNVEQPLDLSKK